MWFSVDAHHGSRPSFLISTNTLSGLLEIKYIVVTVPNLALTRRGQRILSVQKASLQQNCPVCQRQLDFSPKTSPGLSHSFLQGAVLTGICQYNSSDCKIDIGQMWKNLHNCSIIKQRLARKYLWNSCFHISRRDLKVLWNLLGVHALPNHTLLK